MDFTDIIHDIPENNKKIFRTRFSHVRDATTYISRADNVSLLKQETLNL